MGCPAAALTSRAGWSASRVQLCQKNDEQVVALHSVQVSRGGGSQGVRIRPHTHTYASHASHTHT